MNLKNMENVHFKYREYKQNKSLLITHSLEDNKNENVKMVD